VALVGGCLVASVLPAWAASMLVTVGDVTATSAIVWSRGVVEGPITIALTRTEQSDPVTVPHRDATAARPVTLRASILAHSERDFTGQVRLEGLVAQTRYTYELRNGGETVRGTFVTAPDPGDPTPVSLAWSADLGARDFCRRVGSGYTIFRTIADRRPDLFLFVGDTIYADHRCEGDGVVPGADYVASTLGEFRAKHRYNRMDPNVQALFSQTAVSAIWDDHDVRNNFAGLTESLMPVGRRAFRDYWPLLPWPDDPARLYRQLQWGKLLDIFILDTRQYRSSNCQPDGPTKTMLGSAQREWLIERVSASRAVWKVIVSSVPLSIPKAWPCSDSWTATTALLFKTGFATERDRILQELRDRRVRNVVVLATDVHFAALLAHRPAPDFSFYEFIAGPLSARPKRSRPPRGELSSRVVFAQGQIANFGELTIDPGGLTARIVDVNGAILASERIAPR
jgi:alkaline phosphatase D